MSTTKRPGVTEFLRVHDASKRMSTTSDKVALLAAEIQKHEMDLWASLDDPAKGPPQMDGNHVARSWCKCGELLDNDATDDGWPSMALHVARSVLAANALVVDKETPNG